MKFGHFFGTWTDLTVSFTQAEAQFGTVRCLPVTYTAFLNGSNSGTTEWWWHFAQICSQYVDGTLMQDRVERGRMVEVDEEKGFLCEQAE
jgi:hypothetical protein